MFKRVRLLEQKNDELRNELRKADDINYKRADTIANLTKELEQAKSDCTRLQDKVNTLEEELSILRDERKEIEDKTKSGIDKDAVIIQLILEKDRLAIENLKYHEKIIEKDRLAIENYKASLTMAATAASVCQIPYYPMTHYYNSLRF